VFDGAQSSIVPQLAAALVPGHGVESTNLPLDLRMPVSIRSLRLLQAINPGAVKKETSLPPRFIPAASAIS
jgi:hypothetical protein